MAFATRSRELSRFHDPHAPSRPDLVLIGTYIVISLFGLLMIYSATAPGLEARGMDPTRELKAQAFFVLVGFLVFGVVSTLDLTEVRRFVDPIYIGSTLLLVVVLTDLGESQGLAQRWIDLGPIQFQPSEISKIAVILMLASLLARVEVPLTWKTVAISIVIVGIPSGLIFLQPDLGTMLVFAFVLLAMLFVAGVTMRQLGFLGVATIIGTVGVFQLKLIKAYQIDRLTAFIDPGSHELTLSYNQVQSEIAIGSGGLVGKGLFEGSQTNLQFVPVQSSDFIFTAVGEQFGFIGSVIVIALFSILLFRLLSIAVTAKDRFSYLVTAGVASMLAFHIFVNIGMTIRIMPVTGLPLPFMSAGGTVFVAMSAALGLAHSVWIRRNAPAGDR
ncbi:MAG: rod shape-determining protein RodA [Actinomycetota bacterium]